ncbi:MAG: methyltransferase domain-containing protein [Acidobacteria bacterium]|nr:methyltransferase domain-containing protein [Acidobacteriota bacterium]
MHLHDPSYWQSIYDAEARPGWDMDSPTPLLPELLDLAESLGLAPGPRVAVPGCGFGHDAAELARWGFETTGVDFAPAAILGARARYGDAVEWREEDWFQLEAPPYDAIFDHTCFVAMAPERRAEFVACNARRLRPGGIWLGAFFHTVANPPGPPFATEPEELRRLAESQFEVRHLGPASRSHPRRAGREFLMVGVRRP